MYLIIAHMIFVAMGVGEIGQALLSVATVCEKGLCQIESWKILVCGSIPILELGKDPYSQSL